MKTFWILYIVSGSPHGGIATEQFQDEAPCKAALETLVRENKDNWIAYLSERYSKCIKVEVPAGSPPI